MTDVGPFPIVPETRPDFLAVRPGYQQVIMLVALGRSSFKVEHRL